MMETETLSQTINLTPTSDVEIPASDFIARHIGPRDADIQSMLKSLNLTSLDEMAKKIIPQNIQVNQPSRLGGGISEYDLLEKIKLMMSENQVFRSMIGMGFYDTITPTVIQRNILESPVWYTAYTPYQAEIAQGRLEALLNFQTMIMDLTGMEISNASLLDEGTAAAEAMAMALALTKKTDCDQFLVSPDLHPHVIEVLRTRAQPLGLELVLKDPFSVDNHSDYFATFIQYPNTYGEIKEYKSLAEKIHQSHGFFIVGTDLLALTLLTPPGEWGADIVYGNSQRFGVPLGFGGPHAAYISTKEVYKRNIPGRVVGVSVDAQGKRALRLALQTREQHIRREKATSNICTAQVLLANMASMYAVYHGPQGLKNIAQKIHEHAATCAKGLEQMGFKVLIENYFDTLTVQTSEVAKIISAAEKRRYNFRKSGPNQISISFDETSSFKTTQEVLQIFSEVSGKTASIVASAPGVQSYPVSLRRQSKYLQHPVFNTHHSETQLLRYIHHLQNKDLTLAHSMIALGSCTMKLNATTELVPVSWPEVNRIHPFAPTAQTQGYLKLIQDLETKLCQITGFAGVSLQPNAGSQGEYAGLLVVRKYFESKGEAHRNICLIPSSAHGTNPASAVMAGMKVVVTACDENGNVDLADLRAKAELHKQNLCALMITYPSTHGVFEESIVEICKIIHDCGGQVYMDGANMNALVEVCRPGEFGPDVSHMNLHKTFSIPHGGGGPGIGPIGVRAHLKPFLPRQTMVPESGPATGITSTTSAPWGSASILPISWTYISMMGGAGLKKATLVSILSANYIAKKLEPFYPILYKGKTGYVAHECILDLRPMKKTSGIDVTDVAKRLMDYGFHAPTMSWPVAGTLMVEPTESEDKQELDRFIEAMIQIRKEAALVEEFVTAGKQKMAKDNPLVNAPHTMEMLVSSEWNHSYTRETAAFPLPWIKGNKFWPAVARIDNAYGDKNFVCSCPPLEDYQEEGL